MTKPTPETLVLPRWLRSWEEFWFTPRDPSVLAFIRIACGAIVVYTLLAYSFKLQDMMGEHGWHDLELRDEMRRERPVFIPSLNWNEAGPLPEPRTQWERDYLNRYRKEFGSNPPPPYPANDAEEKILHDFRRDRGIDLRINGLKPPKLPWHLKYAEEYTKAWRQPPPAYPADEEEMREIDDYMRHFGGIDPRRRYDWGIPVFSLWFHVVDPQAMVVLHGFIVLCAFLFTIGFCTRITSALTWFGSLCYIHRNPTVLFGMDTMMTILLLYLMIGPSGAAFSVDRLIARWWSKVKPSVVQAWYRFWKLPIPALSEIAPAPFTEAPAPSVAANMAIRLLQINLCMIYCMSGLSKLQGPAWWNGTAVWMTVGCFEFAPMQFEFYLSFLRFLGKYQWLYDAFITGSGFFTLAFEIGYIFLIWRPKLRWVFLTGAILLHAGIGLFMGLKTFSLMMLVMNMAFLRKKEVYWLVGWFTRSPGAATPAGRAPVSAGAAAGPVTAIKQL